MKANLWIGLGFGLVLLTAVLVAFAGWPLWSWGASVVTGAIAVEIGIRARRGTR